ncbi:TatD DNase family protein [Entamoeba marina]
MGYLVMVYIFGIVKKDSNQTIFRTLQQLATTKQINFVGECGLDSKLCNVPLSIQEMWFKKLIEVSEIYHLPLILHCVNEIEHVRRIRKEINAQQCWIYHGFNGSYQLTQTLIKEGFVISF